MAKKNKHVVIAYFPDDDKANQAAAQVKDWDKANDDIKLGGLGILTWKDDKIKTSKVGPRRTGTGAKWGVVLGAALGILSGGVTLIGGAVAGAAGGAVLGAFFHKNLGLSDEDKQRLEAHLKDGGAALVVMANEDEVAPTKVQLANLGGKPEDYEVPQETMDQVDQATDVAPAEETKKGDISMSDKPNVIFMLADNIGWGDLSCYGNLNPTPNLDKLAADGIRFTNFNTEAQCTPTRSALMTGRMPVRSGTFTVPLGGNAPYGLCPWEYTMGELFSDAGYATGMFGKWHLGRVADRIPTAQGFDEWWGISESSDEAGWTSHPLYPPHFPRPKIKQAVKGQEWEEVDDFNVETRPFMDENIANKTMDFIRRKHEEGTPFYAYVGFTNLHPPVIPHPDFADKTDSPHAGPKVLAELDYRAGQILDTLDELGIADNTIVIWAGDNGSGTTSGEAYGSGGYWRGNFGGGWEGSYRSPAMIRWPGKIPAGVVTDEIVAALDWFPTLAGLVGEADRVPSDRPIDGMDMSAFMTGEAETSGRDHYLYMGVDAQPIAVKWKSLKVHFRYTEEEGWTAPYIKRQVPMVMNLVNDPKELINLMESELTYAWVIGIAAGLLGQVAQSAAQYPNIPPGADFKGYAEDPESILDSID